ncbi:MAG TPA: hypothetical protein VGN18_12915 [Jatrophihabitans sp.]|jgi:MOSC domain-containing protein YiiM|uniref:hypothetical protein n=1 Tax=Jatrophihabitans sp. TaxID=1932789 RepID=UPI002E08D7C0|nr:hypothetical protein [Jatrophihabitans sp.]
MPRIDSVNIGHSEPGSYLKVITPGEIAAGDTIEVVHRPTHPVSIALVFRALTLESELVPDLLAAGDDLEPETLRYVHRMRSAG